MCAVLFAALVQKSNKEYALLISLSYMLVNYEPGLLELITPEVMLCVMGAVFISGILIATLCAYISINKYLKMKAGDLYRL